MELAKVTSKGQVTMEIRKKLGIHEGDKILFMEEGNKIVIMNSTMVALKEAQEAFRGEAQRTGLRDEQDVVDMIREMRRENP